MATLRCACRLKTMPMLTNFSIAITEKFELLLQP